MEVKKFEKGKNPFIIGKMMYNNKKINITYYPELPQYDNIERIRTEKVQVHEWYNFNNEEIKELQKELENILNEF